MIKCRHRVARGFISMDRKNTFLLRCFTVGDGEQTCAEHMSLHFNVACYQAQYRMYSKTNPVYNTVKLSLNCRRRKKI